jgi:FAD/FMN-containing dehydrogenase
MVNLHTGSTMPETVGADAAAELARNVSGRVLLASDEEYDQSRRIFNAMIDRRPALIVRCADSGDVIQGVNFARAHKLPIAVRGGGHGVAGSAVCEGGIMLDMSGMKEIQIDPNNRTATAEPGLTLAEFDRATQKYGLATPLGIVSVTGIAGLTLGGGLGWLNGKHGLAIDNLLAATVVTADGRLLTASSTENEDLFWAIRGGGGNFGIVTAFTYQLHQVDKVLAGSVTFPSEKAHEGMRFYDEFARNSPDELSTAGGIGRDENGRPVFSFTVCYSGSLEEGEQALRPLYALDAGQEIAIAPMDYVALQSAPDVAFPDGRQHYWKAGYLRQLPDAAIETLLSFVSQMPSPYSAIGLQEMCGVASRVDSTVTAFAHRARQYDMLILSQWDDPEETPRNIAWTRSLFEAMEPFLARAVYSNNLGDEGEARIRSAFGSNYERLAMLKAKYDPTNLFHLNQNIKPATAT